MGHKNSCKRIKSFTLIELLVVIAIVGILAGIIIVSMTSATEKATIARAKSFSSSLKNSMSLRLISEYNFNEGSGTVINDSWGGNNGTLTCNGGPCWKTGADCIEGSCLASSSVTDGADSVTIPANASLNSPNQTIEAWVKIDVWSNSTGTIRRASGTDQDWYHVFYGGGGGATENSISSLVYYTNTSGIDTAYVNPKKLISLGVWHHLVFTFGSSGKATFYVDGTLADTKTATSFSHWGRANASNSNANLIIGSSTKSNIDIVRIYGSEMNTSQARQQYVAGLKQLLVNKKITKNEFNKRIMQATPKTAFSDQDFKY